MGRINYFITRHPELFRYQAATEIHPHDQFMDRYFLRFLPAGVTPNRLTLLRIFATPLVFYLIFIGQYKIGMIAFLLVAFTDALDGSLARTKNMITNFGIMFDPLADKFLIGSMVLLLVFQNFQWWLGVSILGLEIVLISMALAYKHRFKTVRMANIWGKIKMILQVLAVFATLVAIVFNNPVLLTVAAGLFGLAIGFAIVSLFAHGA